MSPQCQPSLAQNEKGCTTGVTGQDSTGLGSLNRSWKKSIEVIRCQLSLTKTEQATHQIFGTHADNPHSSLQFSDSKYHSSTLFFSWCTQNIRYFGRCSSLGSPSPCSPLQPVEQSPRRKTLNIQKRQTQDPLSSIHALPWRKLFCVHLFHTHTLSGASLWMAFKTEIYLYVFVFCFSKDTDGIIYIKSKCNMVLLVKKIRSLLLWHLHKALMRKCGAWVRTSSPLSACRTPPLWATVGY